MFRNKAFIFLSLFALAFVHHGFAKDEQPEGQLPKLIIFHSRTCHPCLKAKQEIIPKIEKEFKGRIILEYRDFADIENYKLFLSLAQEHNKKIEASLPVFYLEGSFLGPNGLKQESLSAFIKNALAKNKRAVNEELPQVDLLSNFMLIKPLAVAGAGLVDGVNPCAFTVIVFFISFLSLQGYRKTELIAIGLAFIFAVFLTYIFIGLGLFGFLYRIGSMGLVIKVFNILVGIFSIALGILCLYDFIKFRKTGKTEGLVLQLPEALKWQIHKVIGLHRVDKRGPTKRNIFGIIFSALFTGFLVSLLEAVCTGQMYLPTIAFVLKTTPLKLQAVRLLLLYNFMFIAPLLIIFLFALWGVSSEQFGRFLRRHLLALKLMLAAAFFALGIFLLWKA